MYVLHDKFCQIHVNDLMKLVSFPQNSNLINSTKFFSISQNCENNALFYFHNKSWNWCVWDFSFDKWLNYMSLSYMCEFKKPG